MSDNQITTSYNPGGTGVTYRFQTPSQEDKVFNGDAATTLNQQRFVKFAVSHAAMVNHSFTNSGAGNTIESSLSKAPDYYGTTYLVTKFAGIKPNVGAGATKASWVNGRGFYVVQDATIRVSQQLIHQTDGLTMFVLTELNGHMDTYGSYAGVFKTRAELEKSSRSESVFYALMYGWSFAEPTHPERAWSIGGVAYHQVVAKIVTRPVSQLVINYKSVGSNNGMYSLPLQVNGSAPINEKSVGFLLSMKSIWVGKAERDQLVAGNNEVIFKEPLKNPARTIPPSSSNTRFETEIDFKGPVAFIAVTVRAVKDIASGNWTKDCNDQGGDYIDECMIVTGSVACEDGLPADFYSGPKVTDAFGTTPLKKIYVFSFENNAKGAQMTGHMTTTNMDKVKFSCNVFPHTDELQVDIFGFVYNGWYTENGTCSRIWG